MRRLAVIGEAVKGLPEAFRAQYPEVPWRSIAGARDILVHEYFRVDLALAWEMVRTELPELARQVRRIMAVEGLASGGAL
ncbi:MAG: HepT-like ribonuclease domain-containing protein [Gemmatimonadota bacterium]|nr:HepT-like ribonuclease domain-containing protein [Gemmatimonadota bacterium]